MTNTSLFALLIAGLFGLAVLFGGGVSGTQVSFAFKNFPDLTPGFVYQAWVMNPQDELVSLGRFRHIGNAKNFEFFGDLHKQSTFLISLETGDPDGVGDLNGSDPDLILFAGDIDPLKDIVHLRLISPDLHTPSGGVYALSTPSDNSDHAASKLKAGVEANDGNDAQGIWFVSTDPENEGALVGGLDLPRIPSDNFVYEGWVNSALGNTTISTGRFVRSGMADRNSGQSPFDGGKVYLGYPEPGEDFVNPGVAAGELELPLELNQGWKAAISIEPYSDSDNVPFVLTPWKATIGTASTCLFDTIKAQPNPRAYQQQKCLFEPQYDGVAVIH